MDQPYQSYHRYARRAKWHPCFAGTTAIVTFLSSMSVGDASPDHLGMNLHCQSWSESHGSEILDAKERTSGYSKLFKSSTFRIICPWLTVFGTFNPPSTSRFAPWHNHRCPPPWPSSECGLDGKFALNPLVDGHLSII